MPCQNRQNLVRQRVRLAIELGNDGIPPSYLNRLAGRLRSSPAELGIRIMGYEIADHEWSAVGPAACWSHNSVAIEGIADIRRSLAARRSDANDPYWTLRLLGFAERR